MADDQTKAEADPAYRLTPGVKALLRAGVPVADLGQNQPLIVSINQVCAERVKEALAHGR